MSQNTEGTENTDHRTILTADQIINAGLRSWTHRGDTIQATFPTGDFATGLRLVNLIGESAEDANHHPDVTLTYPEVTVTLSSHDVGGVTTRDISLARVIDEHAATLDLS